MIKPTNSEQVESGQTKEVPQRLESDATPRTLDSSVSIEFSPEVTYDGYHVDNEDTKDIENQVTVMGRSNIILQLGEQEKIHVSPCDLLQI